ncbi:heme-binding protein [Umezawaea sp. Da 62-37]|uniref:GlcG/HbpS family heme-binding protein n=1 Tax=Umezawaea sp. Da 62-37 TaxID=3075927 RepID=UPI0028F72B91|nr:heme-binding protein [Umezawaea sp. Da 62-37]WNV82947.1 heme-binding protein [Umezawaea sp. Da 62-37]
MITYDQSRTIVEQALRHARDEGLPPMTVAVLDAAGQLMAFGREDGSSLLRERIARGKAHGALHMGMGSRGIAARARSHPEFVNALVALADGDLVPVPGGVLVRDSDGQLLGAVGVSGDVPDRDEECALRGVTAGDLCADPGA